MSIEQMELFGEYYGASVAESFKTDNSDADALPKCGDTDEYLQFLKKIELKKTTDDCYTPPKVYDTVADYVSGRWGIPRISRRRKRYLTKTGKRRTKLRRNGGRQQMF